MSRNLQISNCCGQQGLPWPYRPLLFVPARHSGYNARRLAPQHAAQRMSTSIGIQVEGVKQMAEIHGDQLVVGAAQIAPVWLDRDQTLAKVLDTVERCGRPGLPSGRIRRSAAARLSILDRAHRRRPLQLADAEGDPRALHAPGGSDRSGASGAPLRSGRSSRASP